MRDIYVTKERWDKVNLKNKRFIKEFMTQLESERKSENTLKTYENSLRIFCVYVLEELENQDMLELTKKSFRNYSIWLQTKRKLAAATTNGYMSAIRSMLDRFEDDDEIDYNKNTAKRIKSLEIEPVKEITFLTDLQIERLYNELLKTPRHYIHALFLAITYDSTGRRAEIMQADKASLYNTEINNTKPVHKKGQKKKEELVYFRRAKEAARIYLSHRGDDDNPSLWGSYYKDKPRKLASPNSWCKTMSRILSRLENKEIHFTPHDLRHSAIENYTEGTHYMCPTKRIPYTVEEIQRLASHASSAMTQSYKKNVGMKSVETAFGIKLAG